jgi:hypothetical protein
MDIFESLENLNVSEECFDEIMGLVEEILSEEDVYEPAQDRRDRNKWKVYDKTSCVFYDCKGGKRGAQKEAKRLNTVIPAKPKIDLSYESFDDISNILEEIIDTIHKKYKYGAPEYYENGGSDLEDKARAASDKEGKEAEEREGRKGKDIREKRVMTKNLKGELKNFDRKMKQWYKATSDKVPVKTSHEPVVFFDGNKKKVSESLYNEIADLVEELIIERNQENREKKKEWEMTKGNNDTSPWENKEDAVQRRQKTIKRLKDSGACDVFSKEAVDEIARGNRIALGREQDPISYRAPSEYMKHLTRMNRRDQSQRGSSKDTLLRTTDKLMDKQVKKERKNN